MFLCFGFFSAIALGDGPENSWIRRSDADTWSQKRLMLYISASKIPVKVLEHRFRSLHRDEDSVERVNAELIVSAGDLSAEVVERVFKYCKEVIYAKNFPRRSGISWPTRWFKTGQNKKTPILVLKSLIKTMASIYHHWLSTSLQRWV